MMSKEDAIELEKIMKRPLNSPADCLKEVHPQPTDDHEVISSETVQELRIIDVSEASGKTISETSGNEVSKASTKQSYVNPFQNGSKRFTPCSVKRFCSDEAVSYSSEQSDLKNNQILPSFEIRQRTQKQGCCFSSFVYFFVFLYYSNFSCSSNKLVF